MTSFRRLLLLVMPVALVVAAAAAWACVPFPFVSVPAPANGSPGVPVKIHGFEFPEQNRIEVRWDAADGPILGGAMGPEFSLDVAVPDAPEGLHVFVVLSRAENGGVTGKAAASFWVGRTPDVLTTQTPAAPARTGSPGGAGLGASASVAIGAALLGGGLVGGRAIARRRTK